MIRSHHHYIQQCDGCCSVLTVLRLSARRGVVWCGALPLTKGVVFPGGRAGGASAVLLLLRCYDGTPA